MLESSVANYIASLEPWATDDKQIKARLADYVAIQGATYSEHEYDRARKALTDVERGLRTRRAQLLNENPARVAADPTFENHLPEALTGEIQQFLGRRAIDERAFRLVVPVPDEHLPTVTGLEQADFAEDLGSALRSSIRDQIDTLGAKLESEGELLWVYSVDGLLSVGSKDENKHSVVGAGAEAWAAGTVRLKISEGEAVYRRYLSEVEKAAWYKQRVAEIEADESLEPGQRDKLLRDVRDNQREYEKEAERDRREYEKLRYDPDEATRSGKTVVLDFDSGHYRPRGAWRRAMSAWNKLGYKVEFNPEGRTA